MRFKSGAYWITLGRKSNTRSSISRAASFPPNIRRRFAAVAGAFEIIESEFLRLRSDADGVVDDYQDEYRRGRGKSAQFDAFRLTAALEVMRPDAKGWRQAARTGSPFGIAATTMVSALAAVDINNWSALAALLRGKACKAKIESYASLTGCTVDEVSHLACMALSL